MSKTIEELRAGLNNGINPDTEKKAMQYASTEWRMTILPLMEVYLGDAFTIEEQAKMQRMLLKLKIDAIEASNEKKEEKVNLGLIF